MTRHPIKELPDGTRVYSNGTKYKPQKPVRPKGYVWFSGRRFFPLPLVDDDKRVMPATRPFSKIQARSGAPR